MYDQDDHEKILVYTGSGFMGCADNWWITVCCLCQRSFEVRVGEQLMGKVTNIYRNRVWVDVGLVKDGSCSDSQNLLVDKCSPDMFHNAHLVGVPNIKEVRGHIMMFMMFMSFLLC